jgi:hypothetical protein
MNVAMEIDDNAPGQLRFNSLQSPGKKLADVAVAAHVECNLS